MKLVLLVGNAAVGKTTTGYELMKITDLRLFHGHMMLEPVLEIYGFRNGAIEVKIRDIIFEDYAKSNAYGLIFTFMPDFNSDFSWNYLKHIASIFEENGGEVYYVELTTSLEERLKRNITPDRLQMKASKRDIEASTQRMLDFDGRCESHEGEIPFENFIKIDNTNLAPDVVAKMVKKKFNL